MRAFLLLAIVAAVSCDDLSLQVRLTIPDAYEESVVSAELSVIVPPAGAPFDCEDIAFGAVTEQFVRANTVEELLLSGARSGRLREIPREGTKLFWARGYDASGEQIVAGCSEYGLVSGSPTLDIVTEAVTLLVLPALAPSEVPGRTTEVLITDVLGKVAAGIEVRWTRTSSGIEPETSEAISDASGVLRVEVGTVNYPGPIAVDLHAKWHRGQAPVLVGFRNPDISFSAMLPNSENIELRNLTPIYRVGRFGPNGEMGFAALSSVDSGGLRQVYSAYYNENTSQFVSSLSERLPVSVSNLAAIKGSQRDHVVAVSISGLTEILVDGSTEVRQFNQVIAPARSVFSLGDCSDSLSPQPFLVTTITGAKVAIDDDGNFVPSLFASNEITGNPIASGCLTIGGALVRSLVFSTSGTVHLWTVMEGALRSVKMGIIPAGVGFTAQGNEEESLLLGTTFGVSGTDIVRYRMIPVENASLSAEVVTSDATPSFSLSTGSGDIDGDGLVDVIAIVSALSSEEEATYRLFVSLGLQATDGRVVGISGQRIGERPVILIRDFDQNGIDDILIGTVAGFELFLMGPFQN